MLSGVVVLTFIDVILRYWFSMPLQGRQDVVEMGMVVSVMLAAPYAWVKGGHISVDLYSVLPSRVLETARGAAVRILTGSLLVLLAWQALKGAEDASLFNEATNMIGIPHRPFMLAVAAASLLHVAAIAADWLIGDASEREAPRAGMR